MDVYQFEKSYLERLKEAEAVLSWDGAVMPASQVRTEWKSFVELQIEPTGWQAIWQIPRIICEDLKVRYPTIVCGYVDQVIFDELKAVFVVTGVQDNDVHLPERNEVSLVELWPTIQQENSALNIDVTAECIDRLRFFYSHVWMPWDKDYDDDRDWVQMHLQSRIQLACELSKNKLPRPLALHIRTLLFEARYIQQRLEYLELDLSDTEERSDDNQSDEEITKQNKASTISSKSNIDANVSLNKSNVPVTDLMCLHLRLAIIRSEFEILENPEMRRAYSELKSKGLRPYLQQQSAGTGANLQNAINHTPTCYVVTMPFNLQEQLSLLNLAKQYVQTNTSVQMGNNLQDVLSICQANDDILLSPGQHTVKFLEHLHDNGSIMGLVESNAAISDKLKTKHTLTNEKLAIVSSSDQDSILLVIDGDYNLSQLVLDSRHVRRCIHLRKGTLRLRGCRLIGDGHSSTQEGIVCMPHTKLIMENCVLEKFAAAISLQSQSSAELSDVTINDCKSGLELLDKSVNLNLKGSNCKLNSCRAGIVVDGLALDSNDKAITLKTFSELQRYNESNLQGSCNFKNCTRNVRVHNELERRLSVHTYDLLGQDELAENKENIR